MLLCSNLRKAATALAVAALCLTSSSSAEELTEAESYQRLPVMLGSGKKLRHNLAGAAVEMQSEPALTFGVTRNEETGEEETVLLQMAADEMLDAESRRAGRKALAEGAAEAAAGAYYGTWPPPVVTETIDASACPSLSNPDSLPTSQANGVDWSTGLGQAALDNMSVDPNASPKQQAMLFCQTSILCMVGYAVGSGLVFDKSFWTDSAAMAKAMGQTIAKDFRQTISPKNIDRSFTSLGGKKSNKVKCTYSFGVCGPNGIPTFQGVDAAGWAIYSCNPWNTGNYKTAAAQVMQSCANSCEVLQWLSIWWKYYRVGRYTSRVPTDVFDPVNGFYQDYCGGGGMWTVTNDSRYNGGRYKLISTSFSNSYAQHDKCLPGVRIPLCRSFQIATSPKC